LPPSGWTQESDYGLCASGPASGSATHDRKCDGFVEHDSNAAVVDHALIAELQEAREEQEATKVTCGPNLCRINDVSIAGMVHSWLIAGENCGI